MPYCEDCGKWMGNENASRNTVLCSDCLEKRIDALIDEELAKEDAAPDAASLPPVKRKSSAGGVFGGLILVAAVAAIVFFIAGNTHGGAPSEPVDPQHFVGSIDTVTKPFAVRSGPLFLSAIYHGTGNFAVWVHGEGNEKVLAFNEIGDYDGERTVSIGTNGDAYLEIQGDGSWTVDTHQ